MPYAVKEMYLTLQGEGGQAGRAAVFCRFSGCNLWNGRESDRATAACRFCDTDFIGTDGPGGGRFQEPTELAERIEALWVGTVESKNSPYVVFTGGEPGLQIDEDLVQALQTRGFEVGIETNGTVPLPPQIDWVCVSPKPRSEIVVREGQELKFVFPQDELSPETFSNWRFDHFFIQPMDGPKRTVNTALATTFCLKNPHWRLSLQTHKLIGIP